MPFVGLRNIQSEPEPSCILKRMAPSDMIDIPGGSILIYSCANGSFYPAADRAGEDPNKTVKGHEYSPPFFRVWRFNSCSILYKNYPNRTTLYIKLKRDRALETKFDNRNLEKRMKSTPTLHNGYYKTLIINTFSKY